MSTLQPVKISKLAEVEVPAVQQPVEAVPSAAEVARKVRRARARGMLLALSLWVGLPTLLGVIYYGFVARSQYESVATLVVKGDEGRSSQRAVIFREYVQSRDALAQLDKDVQFSRHYQEQGDMLARLGKKAGSEARFQSFRKHVDVQYENRTHVLTLRVRAFSSKQAKVFAERVLELGNGFVSKLDVNPDGPMMLIARPSQPSDSNYPHRAYAILTVFLVSLALFSIGSLLIAAIREHAQF